MPDRLLLYYNSNSLTTFTQGLSDFGCLLYFLASDFYNDVIKVKFDYFYFFLFIVFRWHLFPLVTSRWLYGFPWFDTHLVWCLLMCEINLLLPWPVGNLELFYSVPQVRRMVDEGSPRSLRAIPIPTRCIRISETLRLCVCCVWVRGGCPRGSQMMKQSDTDSVWGTWAAVLLDDRWEACWLRDPVQMAEERTISMASQFWGCRVPARMEWSQDHLWAWTQLPFVFPVLGVVAWMQAGCKGTSLDTACAYAYMVSPILSSLPFHHLLPPITYSRSEEDCAQLHIF